MPSLEKEVPSNLEPEKEKNPAPDLGRGRRAKKPNPRFDEEKIKKDRRSLPVSTSGLFEKKIRNILF